MVCVICHVGLFRSQNQVCFIRRQLNFHSPKIEELSLISRSGATEAVLVTGSLVTLANHETENTKLRSEGQLVQMSTFKFFQCSPSISRQL